MKRCDAIAIIEREQNKGHFEPKLDEAISLALYALKDPDVMSCGYCCQFADEGVNGDGWCKEHDRTAHCDDSPCGHYE